MYRELFFYFVVVQKLLRRKFVSVESFEMSADRLSGENMTLTAGHFGTSVTVP